MPYCSLSNMHDIRRQLSERLRSMDKYAKAADKLAVLCQSDLKMTPNKCWILTVLVMTSDLLSPFSMTASSSSCVLVDSRCLVDKDFSAMLSCLAVLTCRKAHCKTDPVGLTCQTVHKNTHHHRDCDSWQLLLMLLKTTLSKTST